MGCDRGGSLCHMVLHPSIDVIWLTKQRTDAGNGAMVVPLQWRWPVGGGYDGKARLAHVGMRIQSSKSSAAISHRPKIPEACRQGVFAMPCAI